MINPLPCLAFRIDGDDPEKPEQVTLLSVDTKTHQALLIRQNQQIEIHPWKSLRLKSMLAFGVKQISPLEVNLNPNRLQ